MYDPFTADRGRLRNLLAYGCILDLYCVTITRQLNLPMFTSSSVINLAFSPWIWACFFCEVAGFFEDLWFTCFWSCFNWNLLVFGRFVLWIAFLSKFMALFLFQFTAKSNLGIILWKCAHFGSVFRMCLPVFLFNFPADFLVCWRFLPNARWACF